MHRNRALRLSVLIATLLSLLTTACGGVLNPPPPPPTPTAFVPSTPRPRPPTATPEPEVWVKNHQITQMWSGPEGQPGVVSFGRTSSTFCSFRIDKPQDGPRIYVYNPQTDSHFWIDGIDVGPIDQLPPQRAGVKPSGVNCTEAVYDGRSVATTTSATPRVTTGTPAPSGTPGQAGTLTPQPGQTNQPATVVATGTTGTPVSRTEPRLGQPLVMALYYPWYDETTWESGQTSDVPTVPYSSAETATIARQVGWAREAGIDVLVSAWFGPKGKNPTETNFQQLLTEADRTGIKAALLLETDSDEFFASRAEMATALKHFLSIHAERPGYLRVDGKPVIFVWNPKSVYGTDGPRVNAKSAAAVSAWRSLLAEVDPERRAMWIAEGDYFELLSVFDGIFPYSVAWSGDPARQLASYGETVRARGSTPATRKVWAAVAMPGYDDTRIRGREPTFAVSRQDGEFYRRTFQGAIDSKPDWIVITSFNEWLEGTQIEPSQRYGRQYLDLTRTLADRFRAAAAPR